MGLFLENKDGTWNLAGGSVIQILFVSGKRKKMGISRSRLPVTGMFVGKEMVVCAFFDLAWASTPIESPEGTPEGRLCSVHPLGEHMHPQRVEATTFLTFETHSSGRGIFSLTFSAQLGSLCCQRKPVLENDSFPLLCSRWNCHKLENELCP